MYDILVSLASELRKTQIPVSLTEVLDAAAAMAVIGLHDREVLRTVLCSTMVKHSDHIEAFDVAFDVYFGTAPGDWDVASAEAGAAAEVSSPRGDAFAQLSGSELSEVLLGAVRTDNRLILRRLAEVFVTRYGKIEPGRAVAGRAYLFNVLRAIDLDTVAESASLDRTDDELTAAARLGDRLRRERVSATVEYVRTEIEAEIRRRLVADRGADAVAPLVRPTLPEAVGFMNASSVELQVIRRAVAPLARKLAIRLARTRRRGQRGELDFRRTFRASLSTGGTPAELRFKPPSKPKPEIVVIADVSGSVSAFSQFTLQLLYAMRSEFRKVRTFAFIDSLLEVTDVLDESTTAEQAWSAITNDPRLIWLDGRSDYGHALEMFALRYDRAVTSRSTVLVLGDARNNYRAAQESQLKAIARKAHHLFWLNPEARHNWNTGDSVMHLYEPYCERALECRDLAQLKSFADSLTG
jgi:uncharacterized protein